MFGNYIIVLGCFFGHFFFQAEDGIRDGHVTGVQTCALPISWHAATGSDPPDSRTTTGTPASEIGRASCRERIEISGVGTSPKVSNNKNRGDHSTQLVGQRW